MRRLFPTLLLLCVVALAACSGPQPAAVPPPAPVALTPRPLAPVDLVFYETPTRLLCGQVARDSVAAPLDRRAIDAFVARLDATGGDACLESLAAAHDALRLNDWAYFLFVRDLAFQLFDGHETEATLFAWHAMRRSGYDALLYFNRQRPFLLLASDQQIMDLRQIWQHGQRYYFALPATMPQEFDLGAAYPAADTTATRTIDFRLKDAPKLATTLVPRELTFKFEGQTYSVPSRYNEGLIRFLEDYPRATLPLYFDASLSRELEDDLVAGLGPLLEGRTEFESLNLLLAFVHRAFRYQEDQKHFGYERYLLPDEMFFYPYSDCEDRSIFFAYLVRRFLDLDVIGLRYPNHVATAVRTRTQIPGLHVSYQDAQYLVADPSFFGSEAGAVVPQVAGHEPELIVIPRSPAGPALTGSSE